MKLCFKLNYYIETDLTVILLSKSINIVNVIIKYQLYTFGQVVWWGESHCKNQLNSVQISCALIMIGWNQIWF